MAEEIIQLESNQEAEHIIKVIGVGGGGSNAVNHMFNKGITDVNFMVCNTDGQALDNSPVPTKIHLGKDTLGAGNEPQKGEESALENIDDLKKLLDGKTKMVFLTAGMGGGTGTGAVPVIAQMTKELGILTVAIITFPFGFEGEKRKNQALEGIKKLRKHTDALLIIHNDQLIKIYGDQKLSVAFAHADDVLAIAAKGIAEIITVHGIVNVDFADVETVMKDSGVAIMGTGVAEGEERAREATKRALESPLLNNNSLKGAQNILLNITSGRKEVLMDEVTQITAYIQKETGVVADIIWGNGINESLGDSLSVTIVATGLKSEVGIGDFIDEIKTEPILLDIDKEEQLTESTLSEMEEEAAENTLNETEEELKPDEVIFEVNGEEFRKDQDDNYVLMDKPEEKVQSRPKKKRKKNSKWGQRSLRLFDEKPNTK